VDLDSKTKTPTSDIQAETRSRYAAVGEAIFVTILWASSWVIIKFGLEQENLPPLTFSGLRYTLASVILLGVIAYRREYRSSIRHHGRKWWGLMIVYGIIFVSVTQGAQFVGLDLLQAITVSTLLNLTPIVVLLMGIALLRERPTSSQVVWIIIGVIGAMLYFYPLDLVGEAWLGVVVVTIGVVANSFSSILGRYINKERTAPPIVITGVSMTIGASLLLIAGITFEESTVITPVALIYIVWLSVVNTAFAFTLWNRAMQSLRAVDMTLINSTMLPQIVILSIIFLGEMPDLLDWCGLILLTLSVAFVQVSQSRKENSNTA
jgi:drug/metabolite transporter (DMT)-like permease